MDIISGIEHIKHRVTQVKKQSHHYIHKSYYYELVLIQYMIIILSGLAIRYYFRDGAYFIFLVIVVPLLMVSYSTWNHINSTKNDTELLQQLTNEIESEQTPNIIPLLLFSLSIVVQYVRPKLFNIMVTYMLWAIIFGTIAPHVLKQNIFDYTDLRRLVVFSELEFTFVSIAIGYMILSISILLKN